MEENSKVNFLDKLTQLTKENKVKWNFCGNEKKNKFQQSIFKDLFKNHDISKTSL